MKTVAEVMQEIEDVRKVCNKMENVTEGDTVDGVMSMAIEDLIEYADRYIAELMNKGIK